MTVASDLAALGWRTDTAARTRQAVRDYQGAWNLGAALTVDGDPGPLTRAALRTSMGRRAKGLGTISEHFNATEFRCRCSPVAPDCRRIWITRDTVQAAERLRTILGPFTPLRACRCPRENARVGGASASSHLYGRALDLGTERGVYDITVSQVRALGIASGIGYYVVAGRQIVRHIDTRTTAPTTAPATWDYGAFDSRTLIPPRPDLAKPTPPTPEPPRSWFDMATEADLRKVIRDELAALPREVWRFKNEDLEPDRDAYHILRDIPSDGIDPAILEDAIAKAVATGVTAALGTLEVTVAPKEES